MSLYITLVVGYVLLVVVILRCFQVCCRGDHTHEEEIAAAKKVAADMVREERGDSPSP